VLTVGSRSAVTSILELRDNRELRVSFGTGLLHWDEAALHCITFFKMRFRRRQSKCSSLMEHSRAFMGDPDPAVNKVPLRSEEDIYCKL